MSINELFRKRRQINTKKSRGGLNAWDVLLLVEIEERLLVIHEIIDENEQFIAKALN